MAVSYLKTLSSTGPRFTPRAGQVAEVSNVMIFGTADLAQDTTFDIGYVPRGCVVTGGSIMCTDMDSGTSAVLAVGDSGDVDRFINGGTIAQAGGNLSFGNNTTAAASLAAHVTAGGYTADTKVYGTVITAPGTAVAGTIAATVRYTRTEPVTPI